MIQPSIKVPEHLGFEIKVVSKPHHTFRDFPVYMLQQIRDGHIERVVPIYRYKKFRELNESQVNTLQRVLTDIPLDLIERLVDSHSEALTEKRELFFLVDYQITQERVDKYAKLIIDGELALHPPTMPDLPKYKDTGWDMFFRVESRTIQSFVTNRPVEVDFVCLMREAGPIGYTKKRWFKTEERERNKESVELYSSPLLTHKKIEDIDPSALGLMINLKRLPKNPTQEDVEKITHPSFQLIYDKEELTPENIAKHARKLKAMYEESLKPAPETLYGDYPPKNLPKES